MTVPPLLFSQDAPYTAIDACAATQGLPGRPPASAQPAPSSRCPPEGRRHGSWHRTRIARARPPRSPNWCTIGLPAAAECHPVQLPHESDTRPRDSHRAARRGVRLTILVIAASASLHAAAAAPAPAVPAAPGFGVLVDRYLDRFGRFHPSIAAGNGLHGHDGELEDFSARAVAAEIRWLHLARGQFAALDPAELSPDERVDREILTGVIDGWLLDLDTVRSWQRNPMIYVAAVSDGMHDLVTMESAPAAERMAHATSKLHRVPALLSAARANIRNPPAGIRGARHRDARWRLGPAHARPAAGIPRRRGRGGARAAHGRGKRREPGAPRLPGRTQDPGAAACHRRLRDRRRQCRGPLPRRGTHRPAGAAAAGHRRARAGARTGAVPRDRRAHRPAPGAGARVAGRAEQSSRRRDSWCRPPRRWSPSCLPSSMRTS